MRNQTCFTEVWCQTTALLTYLFCVICMLGFLHLISSFLSSLFISACKKLVWVETRKWWNSNQVIWLHLSNWWKIKRCWLHEVFRELYARLFLFPISVENQHLLVFWGEDSFLKCMGKPLDILQRALSSECRMLMFFVHKEFQNPCMWTLATRYFLSVS